MKYLLTGAAGFICSHLQKHLERGGHSVIGLDNLQWSTRRLHNLVVGDVRDISLVNRLVEKVDTVIHAAAQINVDYGNLHPNETVDINVQGTLNILEACRKYKKKFVYASTSEIYGSSTTERMDEQHPLNAQSVYGASKLSADRFCRAYYDTYGLDVRILRNFNTFGPYQRYDSYGGVIAIFVDRALSHQPPVIFGDGEQRRDYMWISDAVAGYELITELGRAGEAYNIGSGATVSINELAELVRTYTGCPEPVHAAERPGEVRRLCADTTKAQHELGFVSKTDFERDLVQYIEWVKTRTSANRFPKARVPLTE